MYLGYGCSKRYDIGGQPVNFKTTVDSLVPAYYALQALSSQYMHFCQPLFSSKIRIRLLLRQRRQAAIITYQLAVKAMDT